MPCAHVAPENAISSAKIRREQNDFTNLIIAVSKPVNLPEHAHKIGELFRKRNGKVKVLACARMCKLELGRM